MNLRDPGRILCRDDSRLPRMLISSDAADMNDPVADNDTDGRALYDLPTGTRCLEARNTMTRRISSLSTSGLLKQNSGHKNARCEQFCTLSPLASVVTLRLSTR